MFQRTLAKEIQRAATSFYAVSVVGPRQSGKTTLLQQLFPEHRYLNLEDPATIAQVKLDPKGFFANPDGRWIIDEAQEYPELFSFLLGLIDKHRTFGQFILSGSKNYVLMENISQSLAGRVAILELLPLSYAELASDGDFAQANIWHMIYQGSYPGPYYHHVDIELWYKSYVATYLQRDVRQLIKVKDLAKFHLFLKLCAGRHAQLINLVDIGAACGVSHTTVSEWINLLELSYIVFRLQPYHQNFNKRLVKTPKLYFYDTGLVCHLLGIESAEHAALHASRGPLFEGYVLSEIAKQFFARGKNPSIYFWNAHKQFEIDVLIERPDGLMALEVKSSGTFSADFVQQLRKWQKLTSETSDSVCAVVYTGDESRPLDHMHLVAWRDLEGFITAHG